ncbi:MAG: hypothetical protein AB4368_04710 [Xenococcaceae cyanobacterium]
MNSNDPRKYKHFCIFDYFLDGVFLKWEEVKGECPILVRGQDWVVCLEDGTEITAKISGIEVVSDNEHRILLSST